MKVENRKDSNVKIARSINIGNETEAMSYTDGYCTELYIHNNETYEHDLDTPLHYDTLSQNDIVRNQYLTLPYPAVSEEELRNEKIYYDTIYKTGIRKLPYIVNYGISFEALNHYLYKGRNTFRLA